MNWDVVFNYFMGIKHYLGDNFNLDKDFKDLIKEYGTQEMIGRLENLQLTQFNELLLIRYAQYTSSTIGESEQGLFEIYDGFYKECRSLVIDLINEEIVFVHLLKTIMYDME